MIQPFTEKHIDEVSKIHLSSWAPHEISVKLGEEYVRDCFYYSIIRSEFAFGYVYIQDGKIIAYATGYMDYTKFFKEMKKNFYFKITKVLITKSVTGKLNVFDILNIVTDYRVKRNLKFPAYHQNGLALCNEYKKTDAGKKAIVAVIDSVIEYFSQKKCPGCWGITDMRNIPMQRYYIKLGFEKIDIINQFGRRQVVFEKKL